MILLFDPLAVLYLYSSPWYDNGGCRRFSQSTLISSPLRSSKVSELGGKDAANCKICSSCHAIRYLTTLLPFGMILGCHLQSEGAVALTWYFLSSASPPANSLVSASEASNPKFSVNRPPWLLTSDSSLVRKCLGAGLAPLTTGLTSKSFPLPVKRPIAPRMLLLKVAKLDWGGGGVVRFDGVSCASSTARCSEESFLFFAMSAKNNANVNALVRC